MKLTLIAALAALLAFSVAAPATAHEGIHIIDPYARVIGPAGSAYFRIENHAATDDTLLSATSPDAGMVMLMTSAADANGVLKMRDMPEGFPVKAHDIRLLASAADHVMLMDLTHAVKAGDTVTLVLTFQNAGQITLTLPVDNQRRTEPGAGPTPHDAASDE